MKKLIYITFLSLTIFSCERINGCVEGKVKRDAKKSICTVDCPGVCGCNGKFYCNECDAKKDGLTSWKEGPCPEKK